MFPFIPVGRILTNFPALFQRYNLKVAGLICMEWTFLEIV